MITLAKEGSYRLIETKHNTKILYLDSRQFAWVEPVDIGEILVTSHVAHTVDCILALGDYRLYTVKDEPSLSDNPHLELSVGRGTWQGYLLPTGLPDNEKKRSRIIPTHEIITTDDAYIATV